MITETRDDLVTLSTRLAALMSPDMLADAKSPLVVSVEGSLSSGKKIFADVMREKLLASSALVSFAGREGFDEFWLGAINNKPVEIGYVDVLYGKGYANPSLNSETEKSVRQAFMNARHHGGVTFVQNDKSLAAENMSGLDLWLEKSGASSLGGSRLAKSPLLSKFLQKQAALQQQPGGDQWLRYVEVTVKDPRLLAAGAKQKLKP